MSNKPEKRSVTGFEEWGGYMSAKRAKLNVQFNESSHGNGCESEIFTGVSISINGHVNPTNLRSIFLQHGGTYESFATSSTDFVIAENLSEATKRKWGSRTVRPEWIMESITAGKKLDHRKYLLYDFNQENRQLTLSEAFKGNSEVPMSNQVQDISASPKKTADECASNKESSPKKDRRLQAWEDGFLEEFWNHSRLHCISSMKRTLQQHVAKLKRSASTHDFPELERYQELVYENNNCSSSNSATTFDTVLFLVDLDCFFVSVGRLTRPEMVNRPVAVTHFTGSNKNITSSSDIACASYEARKYGVRNGMYVSMAKELCPELEVIPYDFEAYQRISMIFCNVITGLTLDVEPGSIDELLVDVTPVLNKVYGSSPVHLAEFLRRRIFEETKCTASVGIGKNRLLAKLASKKAKPDGVHMIHDSNLSECLENQPLRDLTGVGYSMMQTLEQHHPSVQTCGQMQQVKLEELKNLFGAKKGETVYNACRGVDDSKLNFEFERPKSISIDVNYGIRLTEKWQFEKLLTNICKAISKRAQEVEAVGTKVTVKILTQMQGAPEPSKSGGHGWCDEMTKTLPLMNPTRNNLVIFKGIQSVLSNFTVPVEKYRGVSVQLTGLKFDFDGGKRGIQPTLLTSLTKIPVATVSRPPEVSRQEITAEVQRRLDLKSPTKRPVAPVSNVKLDESVLRALPESILKETLELYGFSSIEDAVATNSSEPVPSTSRAACLQVNGAEHLEDEEKSTGGTCKLSESFMAELPDDIREEFRAEWDQVMKPADPQPCMPIIAGVSPRKPILTHVKQSKVRSVEVKADEGTTAATATTWVNQRVVSIKPKENTSSVPFNRINWWHYDGKDELPTERNAEGFVLVSSSTPPEDMSTWELNGKSEISEVRSAIRDRVYALPNPDKEQLDGLIKYFERLITGHRIKKVQLLMRFLSRFSEDPNITAKWSKICKLIIFTCQTKIQRSFGVPLQLHNIEDDTNE